MRAAQKRAPTGAHALCVALWCALCALPSFSQTPATEQTVGDILGVLDDLYPHSVSIDSHVGGIEAELIRVYGRQLDGQNADSAHYRVEERALGTITNQFRPDWFSSLHGGENYVSSTRGYYEESDEITQAAEYSNMTNGWSSIGEVSRPQIDDIHVSDSLPDTPSVTGEPISFNPSFRILDSDVMASICGDFGLPSFGAWDADFGSSGAISVISGVGQVLSQVWLFVGRLIQAFIVLSWWRRIRDFLFALFGQQSQPEPSNSSNFRSF